jgi:hypothetical protein
MTFKAPGAQAPGFFNGGFWIFFDQSSGWQAQKNLPGGRFLLLS